MEDPIFSLLMATEGTEICNIGHDPLDISCEKGTSTKAIRENLGPYPGEKVKQFKMDYFDNLRQKFNIKNLEEFAHEFITIEESSGGVTFKVDSSLRKKVQDLPQPFNKNKKTWRLVSTLQELFNEDFKEYANIGQSIHVADLNNDGQDDLIIGAPGWQEAGLRAQGCVFISESFPLSIDQKLCSDGKFNYERFGHSITSLDFNEDGLKDLVIGSPRAGTQDLTYHGCVDYFARLQENEPFNIWGNFCPSNDWSVSASDGSELTAFDDSSIFISGKSYSTSSSRQSKCNLIG